MKIIRQFKQGRSQESIIKSMTFGDVFILRNSNLKFILSSDLSKSVVTNEQGTVFNDINGLIERGGGIKAIYHKDFVGEYLEHLLIQAEKDLRYDKTVKNHYNNGISLSNGRLYVAA